VNHIILLVVHFVFMQVCLSDDRIDKLTKRVNELELQQQELMYQASESNSQVNSFIHDNLTLGGFFEPSYTLISGPDTVFQASNSSNLLGINLASDFSNKLRFVSQFQIGLAFPLQNIHNDPRYGTKREFGSRTFGSTLTQGYLDYSIGETTHLSGGVGYAPFGQAPQLRELVLFVRRGGPQILRTNELLSPLWSGFHFYDRLNIGVNNWGYNVYSFNRPEDPRIPGLGARVWWSSRDEALITGFSIQSAKYNHKIDEIVGADLKAHLFKFILTAEFTRHFKTQSDPWTAYIEPSYFIHEEDLLLYTFVDFAQSALNKTAGTIADPFQKFEYGGGLNWLPTVFTRIRLGLTLHDYIQDNDVIQGKNRDYTSMDISVGVAF
jgi:hypothetical protein